MGIWKVSGRLAPNQGFKGTELKRELQIHGRSALDKYGYEGIQKSFAMKTI